MLNHRLFVSVSHRYLVSSLKAKHAARKLDRTKRTGMQNTSDPIIQPAGFYIAALSSMLYSNVYVMFLTVIYVITIMCNVFLIAIIFYDHRLHVPKFMAVGSLALVDLVLSTSLVFIAICFPLKQKSINTNIRMAYIICAVWFFNYVNSNFCDFAPVLRLSCNNITTQWTFATTSTILPLLSSMLMKNNQSRYKALGTCSEYLILVAIFFIPIFIIFNLGHFGIVINPNVRTVCLSLSSLLPPYVNPILYSLKTKEIQSRIRSLLIQRLSIHPLNIHY
uniref:Odorant receptor, family D, subfamily 108, member 1 n=1 Tax=Sinocyclocheilus anshuiensis TaxID=1608454 RepID=A0A671KTF1_9TELE